KWANLASHNAGVTVIIVGITNQPVQDRYLYSYSGDSTSETAVRVTDNINAYLVAGPDVLVGAVAEPISDVSAMSFGNMPNDGGNLLLSLAYAHEAICQHAVPQQYIRSFLGSQEFIRGIERRCIWVDQGEYAAANDNAWLHEHFDAV